MTAAEARAQADMTLTAETDADQGPFDTPVIPPGRMIDFRREWLRRPHLRATIHAAARAGRERCSRSKVAMALWEASQSDEWRRDDCPDGGIEHFPYYADFASLRSPEEQAALDAWEREPALSGRALVAYRIRVAQGRALDRQRHEEAMAVQRAADEEEREMRRAIRAGELGGAWRVRMKTMFSMSDTTGRLKSAEELEAAGYMLDGNVYRAPTSEEAS